MLCCAPATSSVASEPDQPNKLSSITPPELVTAGGVVGDGHPRHAADLHSPIHLHQDKLLVPARPSRGSGALPARWEASREPRSGQAGEGTQRVSTGLGG